MKAIIFDFDGTITYKSKNIWDWIWTNLGFDLSEGSEYDLLEKRYTSGEISYQKWCDITCDMFREKGLSKQIVKSATTETKVINGFAQTIKKLKEKGIKLYIVSGSVLECIENVLGENKDYFDFIAANHFVFDKSGLISRIEATKYDYEGKAVFAKKVIKKLGIKPQDVCFVGNGDNDEWVYQTGCKTLCINPDGADFANKEKWSGCIEHTDNFEDILSFILDSSIENEK